MPPLLARLFDGDGMNWPLIISAAATLCSLATVIVIVVRDWRKGVASHHVWRDSK